MKDLPAVYEEPYITTITDHLPKISFELISYAYISFNSFEKIKILLKNHDFGKKYRETNFFKEESMVLKKYFPDTMKAISEAYKFIKKEIKWNGRMSIWASSYVNDVVTNHKGNVADINLALIALLRESGIKAYPILLSTRDHGDLPLFTFFMNKCNYVAAFVSTNGNEILLDATEPEIAFNILPERCLNNKGLIIIDQLKNIEGESAYIYKWKDLNNGFKYSMKCVANLIIEKDGSIGGKTKQLFNGYSGITIRKKLNEVGTDGYKEWFSKNFQSSEIQNLKIENLDSLDKPVIVTSTISGGQIQTAGSILYLDPFWAGGIKENPYKNKERHLPIDLGAGREETFSYTFTIPEGYTIEEKPEDLEVQFQEGSGNFFYTISSFGSSIQVTSKVSMNRFKFDPNEYEYLMAFYDHVVSKHNQKIVLKKL